MPPSLSIMPHARGLLTMDGCAMQNFGYTVEQEGDSFALVFEEPSDAVKFCLQVSACERNEVAYRTNLLPQLQPLILVDPCLSSLLSSPPPSSGPAVTCTPKVA